MRPSDEDGCISVVRQDELQFQPSTDYLIPMSRSQSTVKTDLRSTPSVESALDDPMDGSDSVEPPLIWETSFSQNPPDTIAPRPPDTLATPSTSHILPKSHKEKEGESSPLLGSPSSPLPSIPPREPDIRDRLLSPESEAPRRPPGSTRLTPKQRMKRQYHYYPNKYSSKIKNDNNSGSSGHNTSSSGGNAGSSTSSNASNTSSTASTLPLNPANLPYIPPPLEYVNVEVPSNQSKSREAASSDTPYTINERKEHREISC